MGSINPYYATIILGLIQVLGCTLGLFLVNKLGRRVLLLCSLAFCSLTMTGLAISVHMKWEWISLLSLILFTFSFMMGLSPVPWVLLGELPTGMCTVEEKMELRTILEKTVHDPTYVYVFCKSMGGWGGVGNDPPTS